LAQRQAEKLSKRLLGLQHAGGSEIFIALFAMFLADARSLNRCQNITGSIREIDLMRTRILFALAAGALFQAVFAQAKPDLIIIGSVSVTPNPVTAGSSVTVSYTVKNQGTAFANQSTTRIQIKNASSVLLTEQYFTTSALSAGASTTESRSLSIPNSAAAGTYTVYVILDYNNAIGQSNTNNDIYWTSLSIQTVQQLPDLVVSSLSVSSTSVRAGSQVTVSLTVLNQGSGSAPSSLTRIRLAAGTTITTNDPLLDAFTVGPLAANQSQSFSRTVTIPSTTVPGNYYMGATANADGAITESNGNNNQRTTPITITGTDNATFVSKTIADNTTMSPGQSFTVTFRLRNSGTTTWTPGASGHTLNFVSGNQMGAPSYVALSSSVSPGSEVNINIPMTAPSTTGTYTGYWRMNNPSRVFFGDQVYVQIVVSSPNSDLIPQNLAVTPNLGPAGSNATVSFTIRNQGSGTAKESTTNIRINTSSSNVTKDDPLLASINIPSISPGGTYTVSQPVTIPSNRPTGTNYIWVILDVNRTANQSNETNDRAYVPFTVSLSSGSAKVSQGITITPAPVIVGQNFQGSFTLTEVQGAPITFENITIAILRSDNTHVVDMDYRTNVSIPANGTYQYSSTRQWRTTDPSGNYKAVARGKVPGGNWFDFLVTGSGVNSVPFTVAQDGEVISTPSTPTGPTTGSPGTSYTYSTGGSSSNFGHPVQYQFDWGDGSTSDWLAVGITSASKAWSSSSTYGVKARGRCATHTSVVSNWSSNLPVTISSQGTSIWPNPQISNSPYRTGPFAESAQNLVGQCTWYVFGRIQETGLIPRSVLDNAVNRNGSRGIFLGNANTWHLDATAAGLLTGVEARPGAIAIWHSSNNHNAFQENATQVTESNNTPRIGYDVIVTRDGTRLRAQAGTGAQLLWEMPRFTVMRVTSGPVNADGFQWYELTGNGRTGWCAWLQADASGPAQTGSFWWNFTRIQLQPAARFLTSGPDIYIYPNPRLISPIDGATAVPINATFSWAAIGGATYWLQVSKNSSFTDLVVDQRGLSTNSFTAQLSADTRYWWRVNLGNPTTPSPWSGWTFTTGGTSTGAISVNATLNGSAWSGAVTYRFTGPQNIDGTTVPSTFTNRPTGSYTITYLSGGPSGATFRDITPSATQTLNAGGTVTFTMNFTSAGPSITRVGTNNTIIGSKERKWFSIYGSGFASGATVTLRTGTQQFIIPQDRTKYISTSEIQIFANLSADPASWSAQVTNPNGAASNLFPFSVVAPVPSITSIDPVSRAAGSSGFTLTVNGKEFNSSSVVQWNGSNRSTQRITDANGFTIQLQASISASDIATQGKAKITVFNPAPGGGTSPSVDFDIVPQGTSTLAVQVKNINGTSSPVPGANGVVELYSSTNQLISTQATNASGLATFTNVAPSTGYSLRVYHNPPASTTIFAKEYWGRKTSINITAGATLNESFIRNMPYSLALRAYNSATSEDVTGKTVASGTTVRLELTIQNPNVEGSSSQSVRGRVVLDRNKDSNYDVDQTSSTAQIVHAGSSTRFSYTFAPQNSGQYFFAVAALSNVDGRDVVTDGWQWSSTPLFTVADVAGPTVISTNPRNGDLAAPVTNTLTATFNKDLQPGSLSVRVVDLRNAAVAIRSKTVSGSTLTLSLESTLAYSTGYAVSIDAGAVKDLAGNPNAAYSWVFVTAAPDAPDKPTLASPLDNSTNLTSPVTLRWNAVGRATGYVVQVAKDLSFTEKIFEQAVQGTSVSVTLDQGTLYFWRVLAAVNQTLGPWSTTWRFTTVSTTASKLNLTVYPSNTQLLERGQSVEFTARVTDEQGFSVSGARIAGQDEIRNDSFDAGITGSDGTVRYRTASVPLNATNGTLYTITFRASKPGFSDSPIQTRQVQVSVPQPLVPSISVSQTTVNFSAQHNGSLPPGQSVTITNSGSGTLNWSITGKPPWLDVTPTSGTNNNVTVQIRPNTTALDPNTSPHPATLQVTSTNANNSPKSISVTYTIQSSVTELKVGGVTIYATQITDVSPGVKRCDGNVNINRILNFSGPIDVRPSDLSVSGDCAIYLENIPLRKKGPKVTLYDGSFKFRISSYQSKIVDFVSSGAREFLDLFAVKIKPKEITLLTDGAIINGALSLQQLGVELGARSLELTTSKGLKVNEPFESVSKDLSGIRFTDINLFFDPIQEIWNARFFVRAPIFKAGAGFEVSEGTLDAVYFDTEVGVELPIEYLGKRLNISFYELGGGVYGLANPSTMRINLIGDLGLPGDIAKILQLSFDLNYTLPTFLEGTGELTLLYTIPIANSKVHFDIPNIFNIAGDLKVPFSYPAGIGLSGSLEAHAKLGLILQPNPLVEGNLKGKLQLWTAPPLLPTRNAILSSINLMNVFFPFETSADLSFRNLAGWGTLKIGKYDLAFKIDFEPVLNKQYPKIDLGTNAENLNPKLFGKLITRNDALNTLDRFEGLSLVVSEHAPNNFLRKGASGTFDQIVPLREEVSQIIFRLRGSTLLPQTTLVLPNGTRVNRTDAAENRAAGFSYLEDVQAKEVFWIIDRPAKGDWRIEIAAGTEVYLDVIGFALPIGIHVTEPSSDRTSGRIEWIDSGLPDSARISLYYDRDNQGLDGVLIAQDIRPANGRNSYSWNYSGVPAGSYYVYAIIEDGKNAPVSSYSPGKIIVPSNVTPPSSLEATVIDTSIELRWTRSSSGGVQGYLIKYKDVRDADYRTSFTVRDTNAITISSLVPGRNYQFAISSIDSDNNLSNETVSNVVSFVSLASNNPPIIRFRPEDASQARVWRKYSARINADDADNDHLLFSLVLSPAGMNINSENGEISWIPTGNQVGNHRVSIRVSDGKGGVDSVSYSITVSEPTRPTIALDRNSYSDSLRFAIVTVTDIDANQSTASIEEVSVILRTPTLSRTLTCRETGGNTGVFISSINLKDFGLTVNDTIWATYTSSLGEATTSYAIWLTKGTRRIVVKPDTIWNYAYLTQNTTRTKIFRLRNSGNLSLRVSSVKISGQDSTEFAVFGIPASFEILPDSLQDIPVRFTPTSVGTKRAILVISNNSDDQPEMRIQLEGYAVSHPTYSVSGRVTAIPADSNAARIISGISMRLTDESITWQDTTDNNGNYRMFGLISGNYKISAHKPGYKIKPSEIPFTVTSRDVQGINFDVITEVVNDMKTPTDFELLQNYPNPFNPKTIIRYGLPLRSKVSLWIYNLLGQRVAELVNGEMEAGYHQIEWQPQSGVASGLYFYRLEAVPLGGERKTFSETKKLLFLR
jgi:uncharacterized membrane protein